MRTSVTFQIKHPQEFKTKLLHWAQQFDEVLWLDSNSEENRANSQYSSFDAVLATDALECISFDGKGAFEQFHQFKESCSEWIIGYFSYDLKNDIEQLTSNNFDGLQFPELYFFRPKRLFFLKENQVEILYSDAISEQIELDFKAISQFVLPKDQQQNNLTLNSRISKEVYLSQVEKMRSHIQLGDIYEANFCQEFYAENAEINPLLTYERLNEISKPPFATFFKNKSHYALSASPERYLKKVADKLLSQPIKGTARRSKNVDEDKYLANNLLTNEKERSENIMITDLVRNDLSRTAAKDSVVVEELCGLYSFKQVHQLISTITSKVKPEASVSEIFKTTFPMGSMTGAPKVSAMKIIEELETTKRGLFSGAIGYISPKDDFDFNVVIRSILYNESQNYLSFSVGGAITSKSIPEKEYEECMVKAAAMRQVLEH